MLNQMETLKDILEKAKNGKLGDKGFLYLPRNEEWSMDSICIVADEHSLSADEKSEFDYPLSISEHSLIITFAIWFIPELLQRAAELESPLSDSKLLEAIKYYYENDDFMPKNV